MAVVVLTTVAQGRSVFNHSLGLGWSIGHKARVPGSSTENMEGGTGSGKIG